jgi:hypothetical protein
VAGLRHSTRLPAVNANQILDSTKSNCSMKQGASYLCVDNLKEETLLKNDILIFSGKIFWVSLRKENLLF